jgi:hypothetical protein
LGDRKWFEIQPSSEYKATYAKMTEGIAVYYYFTELYEQLAKQLTKYPIDSVFLLVSSLMNCRGGLELMSCSMQSLRAAT